MHFYGVIDHRRDRSAAEESLVVKPKEEKSNPWAGILQLPWVCHVTVGNLTLLGVI